MENEKKNNMPQGNGNVSGNGNHHHHHYKRHKPKAKKSYFIEPAGAETAAKPKAEEASALKEKKKAEQTPEAPKEEKNSGNNPQNKDRNNKNRSRHHHRPNKNGNQKTAENKASVENQEPEAKEASKPTPTPVPQEKKERSDSNQKSSGGSRRNRGRNHNRGQDRKPTGENTGIGTGENKLMLSLDDQPSFTEKKEALAEEPNYNIAEITLEEILGEAPKKQEEPVDNAEESDVPMVEVVGIRFKSSGKIYYFDPVGNTYHSNTHAIVETARGQEYGEVVFGNKLVKESDTVPPLRPVVRCATAADVAHHNENKEKEDAAFKICNEKIIAHGLDMKLIDVQYTFDNTKLLFYFTSAGRVDFRELVKDLASVFRTRIELRQIGIRDEAKMMGGLGPCGRSLCCSIFLSDFGQVSIKMAKEQNLSLNSSKISGVCGRLMCCLRYEYETYEYEIKRTPSPESVVRTADGIGVVTEMNPLAGTIKVRLNDSPDTPPKQYHREDVTVLQRKQPQADNESESKE